jgi:hypothetical protein
MHFSPNAARPVVGHSSINGGYRFRPNRNCYLNLRDCGLTVEKSGAPIGEGMLQDLYRAAGAQEEDERMFEVAV